MFFQLIQTISIAGETDLALELAAKQPENAERGIVPPRSELLKLISFHLGASGNLERATGDRRSDRGPEAARLTPGR